jgi:hypothetical protein
MLIPAIRHLALSVLLFSSVAAIAQTAASSGNPYTAVKKTTIIQKLADGTTINCENSAPETRDSQGRTMQQNSVSEMQGLDDNGTSLIGKDQAVRDGRLSS